MYESHWNLKRKPFEHTHDSTFYYPGEAHQSASLKLRYVIENQRGAALLSGPPGVGKSMLVRSLFQVIPEEISPRLHLVFPKMPGTELLAYIADELLGRRPSESVPTAQQSVHAIQNGLELNADEGRHAVVAVDEAQLIDEPETLELLRLLLNFEFANGPGTHAVVGWPGTIDVRRRAGSEFGRTACGKVRPQVIYFGRNGKLYRPSLAGCRRGTFHL